MNDFILFTISYALVLLMGFGLINFLSNGFFGTFLRVKASRGKKVLVEVHGITDVYYRAGKFDGTILKYTTRESKKKNLIVEQKQVIRKIGVFCVITDEVNDNVLTAEFQAYPGTNSETYDDLTQRIMMAPQIDNMKEKIILGLLVLTFIGVVILGIMTVTMSGQVAQLMQSARVV